MCTLIGYRPMVDRALEEVRKLVEEEQDEVECDV
jgi:hypothetical protein